MERPTASAAPQERGLSTARCTLRVLSLLLANPDGVSAEAVAEAIGKSPSTAYNLLVSLCDEGYAEHASRGVYRPARSMRVRAATASATVTDRLGDLADDVFERTRKRVVVAVARPGAIMVEHTRGRQGLARVEGLGSDISAAAHALAVGKVCLAHLDRPSLERHLDAGLRRFTSHTLLRPDRLAADLIQTRRRGAAHDREEYAEDLCCVAVPVLDRRHRCTAAVGVAMTARAYAAEGDAVLATLREVTATHFQSSANTGRFLAPAAGRADARPTTVNGTEVPQ